MKGRVSVVKHLYPRITPLHTARRGLFWGAVLLEEEPDHRAGALPLNGCSGEPLGDVSTHGSDDEPRDTQQQAQNSLD